MLTKSAVSLEEVSITGSKSPLNTPQMGILSLSRESIKHIPTIFGEVDVIKALQTQPGVSAGTEGLSGMYVRGGNDDENLYMLDGIPIYKITHLGGLFSALNVEAVIVKGKTSFAASVRRSWLDVLSVPALAIMNQKSKSKGEKTFGGYAFTDANLKINHIFNNRSSTYLMFYYGNDNTVLS
ncbi:hypothetical protein EZS27_032302 [termite gut metagenome]|uniref:TonB-dependent receptor plug domain-containing protein n=1 Tax=termite gut metagenome TaxID=433724 RepID=A0A5J4Q7Y7_9ZZZZ